MRYIIAIAAFEYSEHMRVILKYSAPTEFVDRPDTRHLAVGPKP